MDYLLFAAGVAAGALGVWALLGRRAVGRGGMGKEEATALLRQAEDLRTQNARLEERTRLLAGELGTAREEAASG
ncbi:MAG: hypothetical protein WB626_09425, partial [Bacteroidota bacterium]